MRRPRPPAADRGLLALRLASQLLSPHPLRTPAEVVAWMGAVQAQDFGSSRWALGVRLPGTTEAEIELALSKGSVLRTHLFRGTWHLVAREDLRWMLALVAPRLLRGRSGRERELGLDAATFRRSRTALARALADGEHRTRDELGAVLERAGIPAQGPRLSHLLQRAELEGLVCSGALRRRAPTYALLDARAPPWRTPPGPAESLRELAIRHARGRGPATVADLAAWAGITMTDARAGLEEARPFLLPETIGGQVHWRWARGAGAPRPAALQLLPPFDEYLVGYRDRSAMLEGRAARLVTRNGVFSPCLVARGRVIGLWRRGPARRSVELELEPFEPERSPPARAAAEAARRYGEFLGVPVRASQRPPGSVLTPVAPLPAP